VDSEIIDKRDAEMIQEAKLLRHHKGRLEARMQILEDHNRQLEAQLMRLRQLLEQPTEMEKKSAILMSQSLSSADDVKKPVLIEKSKRSQSQSSAYLNGVSDTNEKQNVSEGRRHSETSSSRKFEDWELEKVMKEIQNSFPSEQPRGNKNVGNLFHMAGQVGKAVGTLVTVMTDDEGSGSDEGRH